jgi:hypothetical protein
VIDAGVMDGQGGRVISGTMRSVILYVNALVVMNLSSGNGECGVEFIAYWLTT